MTLLYMDGFEHQNAASRGWVVDAGAAAYSTATRFGYGNGLRLAAGANRLKKTFTPSAQVYVGFAVNGDSASSASTYLFTAYTDSGATAHIQIRRLVGTNILAVFRAGVQIATSPAVFTDGWHYVEVMLLIHDTTGRCVVKINGAIVVDFTGDTRQAGTSQNIDMIMFGSGSTNGDTLFDDLYICNSLGTINNDFLGDQRIVTLVPTAAGDDAQLTPTGTANNWENVDELPVSSADYNASATVGHRDTYTLADLPATVQTVKGVQAHAFGLKSDAGAASIKTVVKTGGVSALGSTTALATTLTTVSTIHETDPSGSTWTPSTVNSTQVGVEVA